MRFQLENGTVVDFTLRRHNGDCWSRDLAGDIFSGVALFRGKYGEKKILSLEQFEAFRRWIVTDDKFELLDRGRWRWSFREVREH